MGGRPLAGVGPRPGGRHRGAAPARKLHRSASVAPRGVLHHGRRARGGGRLSRNARNPLSHLSRIDAAAAQAPLGDGRQHRGDLARVRAHAGRSRAHVDRVGGAAPLQAGVSRARLGRKARRGGRARTRDVPRPDAVRQPHRQLRPDCTRGVAAHFFPRGPGLRPPRGAPCVASRQRCGDPRGRTPGGAAAGARPQAARGAFRRFLRARAAATGVERRKSRAFHAAVDGRRAQRAHAWSGRHLRASPG